jgi:glycosyltransferase involved in cell wall biosynthesis
MKTLLLTNIPAPYRESVHELVAIEEEYNVIYCSFIESDRKWKFKLGDYPREFLKGKSIRFNTKTIYLQSNILTKLKHIQPDIIIISGFSFPYLLAFVWAKWNGKKVIAFSDATSDSEKQLSFIHKKLREILYTQCYAFIGASKKTLELFKSYGAQEEQLFQSYLCANNNLFFNKFKACNLRDFDVLLSGKMVEGKMLHFSLDVITKVKKNRPNINILLLGDGPLKEEVINRLHEHKITFTYPGFVQQNELAQYYTNAKVLLFPSVRDAWGVVANEACASGTPVITCDNVGAADELIINNLNGYVAPIDVSKWASLLEGLLDNEKLWESMSKESIKLVKKYTYENAAKGLVEAIEYTKIAP